MHPPKAKPATLRALLLPGSRMDRGHVLEVVSAVELKPRRFSSLIDLLWDENPGVANRAADAVERLTRLKPRLAQKWKEALLGLLAEAKEKKLRWNLALLLPRLTLSIPECRRAAAAFHTYLDDPSSIVKTCALHGLADLTRQDANSLPATIELLRIGGRSGTAAMRARSRILLERLENPRRKAREGASLYMFD